MTTEKSSNADQTTAVTATMTQKPRPRHLPAFKVILHNDEHNLAEHVVETIVMLTPLKQQEANERVREAEAIGCSLILVVHKERAELYAEQFQSRGLTVTIEPAD
jgi:ATP-dependent Clp protease adaptor protein ClpS